MSLQSTYQVLGFPESLTVPLVLAIAASGLVPYCQGVEVFNVKIPKISNRKAIRSLKIFPPIGTLLLLAGFLPAWSQKKVSAEPVYSISFTDVSLAAAVKHLDAMASEVSIRLDDRIASGAIPSRSFDISLESATLGEVLDVFCQGAAIEKPFAWERRGRLIRVGPTPLGEVAPNPAAPADQKAPLPGR